MFSFTNLRFEIHANPMEFFQNKILSIINETKYIYDIYNNYVPIQIHFTQSKKKSTALASMKHFRLLRDLYQILNMPQFNVNIN